jgi:hypothetical protein
MKPDEVVVPVTGSVVQQCHDCECDILVSPASLSVLAEAEELRLDVIALCWKCAIKREQELDEPDERGGLMASPDEFLDALRGQQATDDPTMVEGG